MNAENVFLLTGEVGWEIRPEAITQALNSTEGDVLFKLTTPGGDLGDGVAIHNIIADYVKNGRSIEIEAIGEISSAGTVIQQAASKRTAKPSAYGLYHLAQTCACGDSQSLGELVDNLSNIDKAYLTIFSKQLGGDDAAFALLSQSKYFSAEQMLQLGLLDKINYPDGDKDKKSNLSNCSNKKFADMSFINDILGMGAKKEDSKIENKAPEATSTEQTPDETQSKLDKMLTLLTNQSQELQALKAENETIKGDLVTLAKGTAQKMANASDTKITTDVKPEDNAQKEAAAKLVNKHQSSAKIPRDQINIKAVYGSMLENWTGQAISN